MWLAIFLFLATLVSTAHAEFSPTLQLRQPRSGYLDCQSWRLAVETHNIRDWLVPKSCLIYVVIYMFRSQYYFDCNAVGAAAAEFAKSFPISGDGTDVWVFDVDETMLSNLIFFARSGAEFGVYPINETLFYEWVKEEAATPLPGILLLYNTVLSLGFKTVILTGAPESITKYRVANLNKAGYHGWDSLILRGKDDAGKSQKEYKSEKRAELVKKGYRIVGNVGDQWSDLLGQHVGIRTFKVPNPMYYAP